LLADTDATAVLVVHMPLKILRKVQWNFAGTNAMRAEHRQQHWPAFEQWNKDLRRLTDLARYALLCASQEAPYFAARQISTCILDPLHHAPQSSWPFPIPALPPETTLDAEAMAMVEHWAEQLKAHPSSLDIAMRRTLSAVVDRLDPLDGFIDAVLAWENMFSGSPETTMRVCGAIAHLLEQDDFNARATLYKKLQDLYVTRSRIVHGSAPEPGIEDAIQFRDTAVTVALDSMRRLYDHPDLLTTKNSAVRGKDVLLGVLSSGRRAGVTIAEAGGLAAVST
jgi:hypothetical protein